jgi:hypothetical protein
MTNKYKRIMRTKNNWKLFSVFFIIVGCACSIKIAKPIPNNPINYIFDYKMQFVKEAIMEQFLEKPGYRFMRLEYPERDVILSSGAKKVFKLNKNDFYLDALSSSIGKSKIYFGRKGKPLDYYADFHLHLVAIDSTHTKVEISTIDPKVVIGEKLFPSLPHFGANPKYKSVAPSTIEEYEILLLIGKGLGQRNMPKLKEPL